MKLKPDETLVTCQWQFDGRDYVGDSDCARIKWLTGHELKKIANSPQWGDWEILYLDPNDGRFWELTYPLGEMHGGGPPQLQVVAATDALLRYQLDH